MISMAKAIMLDLQDSTIEILHELRINISRQGYKCLTIAVPCYAIDDTQSLSKELYPYIAKYLGHIDWHTVERATRTAILDTWEQ